MRATRSTHARTTPFFARRTLLQGAAASLVLSLGGLMGATDAHAQASADNYPNRAVRVVVNFPPGGPLDILARQLGASLNQQLSQPFVVDNRPGAGGNIGADAVAKSTADGYTILVTIDSPLTTNPFLYNKMPFDEKAFQTLMLLSSTGMTFAVQGDNPGKDLAEVVAQGQKNSMTFSSAGNGSPGHIASSALAKYKDVQVAHVPYRGNAAAITALLSGEVDAGILGTPGLLPHFKTGKLKPIAVTGKERSPLIPDVPTVAEMGMPELTFDILYLAMAPANTPQPVVEKLQAALKKAMEEPATQQLLKDFDMETLATTGAAAQERMDATRERNRALAEAVGLKMD